MQWLLAFRAPYKARFIHPENLEGSPPPVRSGVASWAPDSPDLMSFWRSTFRRSVGVVHRKASRQTQDSAVGRFWGRPGPRAGHRVWARNIKEPVLGVTRGITFLQPMFLWLPQNEPVFTNRELCPYWLPDKNNNSLKRGLKNDTPIWGFWE